MECPRSLLAGTDKTITNIAAYLQCRMPLWFVEIVKYQEKTTE